jgi:acyl-CoA synthetase (AMP-forming)/AMP-acid ligase II
LHLCQAYLSRFPGYYDCGDCGFVDRDGYVHVMGRTDDVVNVAGHRLSTGQLEEVSYNTRSTKVAMVDVFFFFFFTLVPIRQVGIPTATAFVSGLKLCPYIIS